MLTRRSFIELSAAGAVAVGMPVQDGSVAKFDFGVFPNKDNLAKGL